MLEDEIGALEEKMLITYPSSIERRMGAAMASDLADGTHDHAGGNGIDRVALEALNRYSPSIEASAHAIAHYLTIRDEDGFAVAEDNVAGLGVALLRMAHDHGDQESPSKDLEQQMYADINDGVASGEATREAETNFQMPSPEDFTKAGHVYDQAVLREKGKTPGVWTDQVMSAAIAATAGATGEDINSKKFGDRSRMAIARYYSEGHGAAKLEFLHGIATRLTADVRHMADMSDLLDNIERSNEGEAVDKKWAAAVKVMNGRSGVTNNIRHDAAGHYHLLPKSDQTAIQWDLEYANNLTKDEKLRVEAQAKRVNKAWRLNPQQAKSMPHILRKAQEIQQGR